MTLHKTIQQIVQANPALSASQVFERVRPQFPADNASWLKKKIADYRSKFRGKDYEISRITSK